MGERLGIRWPVPSLFITRRPPRPELTPPAHLGLVPHSLLRLGTLPTHRRYKRRPRGHKKHLSMQPLLLPEVVPWLVKFVQPDELDATRAASRQLHDAASQDAVWKDLTLFLYWGETSMGDKVPIAPLDASDQDDGTSSFFRISSASSRIFEVPSWRACAYRWRCLARIVEGDASARLDAITWCSIAASWRKIESWCSTKTANDRENTLRVTIGNSLRAGASAAVLRTVRPKSLRYAYAIHNGQELAWDVAYRRGDGVAMRRSHPSMYHGMFGGFTVYDYLVCQRFKPAEESRRESNMIEFSTNYLDNRPFVVDDDDLRVWMCPDSRRDGTRSSWHEGIDDRWLVNRVPVSPEGSGFWGWFAEFASRLDSGIYRASNLFPDEVLSCGIVLFPDAGESCFTAITNGVRVKASIIHLPRHSRGFAYSIRLRLAENGKRCQLKSRHWKITDHAAPEKHKVTNVLGFGVVGKFPKLEPQGWRDDYQVADIETHGFGRALVCGDNRLGEFAYQSFTGPLTNHKEGGTFAGVIDFVPGEVLKPEGPSFQVEVPKLELSIPEFIF